MTASHPLRRFLARICSADTMARIVDPTLADIRFERGRAGWPEYLVLARALTVHAVTSLPSRARHLWEDDAGTLPRAAAFTIATALVCACPFVLLPMVGDYRNHFMQNSGGAVVPRMAQSLSMVLLLMPQALAITLAPSVLVALPLSVRRRCVNARFTWRVMGLAIAVCVAMGVLINWGTPSANQRYRVLISGNPRLDRGENESSLLALREQMQSLQRSPWLDAETRARVRRGIEYRYEMRLAMIASPLPLALVGLALAASRLARRRPWSTGTFAMLGYIIAIVALDSTAPWVLSRFLSVPPGAIAWLPTVILTMAALGMWTVTPRTPAKCA